MTFLLDGTEKAKRLSSISKRKLMKGLRNLE
ncbi:MAG: hypothetical protein ACJA2S_002078 [Cyclobacteriaceae bacterium]|jgi:hypothetical protein